MASCVITLQRDDGAGFLIERLSEAGIHAWPSHNGRSTTCDIYVEDADFDRARAVIKEAERVRKEETVSEAELIQAEEEDAARRGLP